MEFRILGPLEVVEMERALPLGGPKQRAVLGVLLLHANEVVSSDRLAEELWGARQPDSAIKLVQGYVSGLRRVIGAEVLATQSPGYRLELENGALDLTAFQRLVDEAATQTPEAAAPLLREALALWRGPALADVELEGQARHEAERLNELRLNARIARVQADLDLGRHAELVGELEALVAEHPLQERPRAQLMLALYRSGRQTEALQVYRQTRTALVEEQGLDPSPELQELERRMLAHDPELLVPAAELPDRPSAPAASPVAPSPPPDAPAPARPGRTRKTVSVVFCDLSDSTALAERLDPEALHQVMSRYYDAVSTVLARHGGTLEKFIGDAVVAVFGVPVVSEHDALRAVRSALELRDAVDALNEELEHELGLGLDVHVGVNTGEVFAAPAREEGPLVTGDAVTVAARLQQEADANEILIGAGTYRLVSGAVTAEPVEPLKVRGRTEAVRAWRLLGLTGEKKPLTEAPLASFVGRSRELESVREALAAAIEARDCRLCTVVGPPGIGKSRLAREVIDSLGDAAIALVGRCLPYGEGITYWPLRDMVRQVRDDPRAWIVDVVGDEEQGGDVADRVLGAVGLLGTAPSKDETVLAVRRLFEAVARRRPLLAVIDDVHWAEPTLLELVEHLLAFSSDAPILLFCLARSEFLEAQPDWAPPRPNRSVISLAPFSDEESRTLLERLPSGRELSEAAAERVVEEAEGNPLYLEQLLAWQLEAGDSDASVPPGIQALIAARIDRLDPDERTVLERAAIEGRIFHLAGLRELLPADVRGELEQNLLALVRKDLIHPSRAELPGEEAFRFRHIMIRDAAYSAVPKRVRAELHERFADWIERDIGVRAPPEIVGYHLEQSVRCREELGALDDRAWGLADRARDILAGAGRRALERDDNPAAASLLLRAAALPPAGARERAELLLDLAPALRAIGDLERAELALDDGQAAAEEIGEPRLLALTMIERAYVSLLTRSASEADELLRSAEEAIGVFDESDDLGVSKALSYIAEAYLIQGRSAAMEEALERARVHAERVGDHRQLAEILIRLGLAALAGPRPADEGVRRLREILVDAHDDRSVVAHIETLLAVLEAMRGEFDEARGLIEKSRSSFEELGLRLSLAAAAQYASWVEMLAGNPVAAERELRIAADELESMGDRQYLPTVAAFLAQSLYEQGRDEEVREHAEMSEAMAAEDDVLSQVVWRGAQAKALARRGEAERARTLAEDAVERASATDFLDLRGGALYDLGSVLALSDDAAEALPILEEAAELYTLKGNIVCAERARTLAAGLPATESADRAGAKRRPVKRRQPRKERT